MTIETFNCTNRLPLRFCRGHYPAEDIYRLDVIRNAPDAVRPNKVRIWYRSCEADWMTYGERYIKEQTGMTFDEAVEWLKTHLGITPPWPEDLFS